MYNTQEKRNTKKKGGMFMNSKVLDYILLTLVIIGAVNWGLIGRLH